MKKVISGILATCMLMSPATALAASVGSVEKDAPIANGYDSAQIVGTDGDRKTEYQDAVKLEVNTVLSPTEVLASIDATREIILPKTVILDGNILNPEHTGNYVVGVKGDIPGTETIKITPDAEVAMKTTGKNDVNASIQQTKTSWVYSDLNEETYSTALGTITGKGMTAGHWKGIFHFNSYCIDGKEIQSWNVSTAPDKPVIMTYYASSKSPNQKENGTIVVDGTASAVSKYKKSTSNLMSIMPTAFAAENTIPDCDAAAQKLKESGFTSAKRLYVVSGVKRINENSFDGFDINEAQINGGVENIENGAFSNCNIETVKLGEGMKRIKGTAFANNNLIDAYVPDSIVSVSSGSFIGNNPSLVVSVPYELEDYQDIDDTFGDIETEIRYGILLNTWNVAKEENSSMPAKMYYQQKTGRNILVIKGKGPMKSFPYNWKDFSDADVVLVKKGVTSIGNFAFAHSSHLQSVKLPATLKEIGSYSFIESGLFSISIPEGVEAIGECAFCDTNIKSLYIPANVKYMGDVLSAGGVSVETNNILNNADKLVVDKNNPYYDSRNDCNAIIETATNKIVQGCNNTVIPDGIKTIGSSSFRMCKGLKALAIPDSVNTIESSAFEGCSSLRAIKIPDSVTTIENWTFFNCKNLKDVTLPNQIKKIPTSMFCKTAIENIVIPNSVTYIDIYAFSDCEQLKNVQLSNTLQKIDEHAFENCTSLTKIDFPNSLEYLADHSFEGCTSLASLAIPSGCTVGHRWIIPIGCAKVKLRNPSDPNSKTILVDSNGSSVIPDGVQVIGDSAFYRRTDITSITIPDSVEEIERYALGYTGLKKVYIPDSVKTIDSRAFANCFEIEEISVPKHCRSSFEMIPSTCKIIVRN